jgi:hypothetical protein
MTVHASVRDLPDSLHDEGLFFERLAGRRSAVSLTTTGSSRLSSIDPRTQRLLGELTELTTAYSACRSLLSHKRVDVNTTYLGVHRPTHLPLCKAGGRCGIPPRDGRGRLACLPDVMSGRTQGSDVTTWSTLAAGPPDA